MTSDITPPTGRLRYGLSIAMLAMLIDQLHKWLMLNTVDIAARGPITVTGFFDLVMVWNRGVSFGMLQGDGMAHVLLLSAIKLIIVGILLVWLRRTQVRWVAGAIGLIIGGALGNLIDRLRFGGVADFFSFHIGEYYWPAFNIADSAICIGVALLFLESMLPRTPKTTEEPPSA